MCWLTARRWGGSDASLDPVGLVCLLAVSCGDGGSGEQEGYVDAIAVSLASGDPTAINLARG